MWGLRVGSVESVTKARWRRLADRGLSSGPMSWTGHALTRRQVRVLAYHAIDDPDGFARQLEVLAHRYHPISLADLDAARTGAAALPERAVLLTFDDGYRSVLTEAAPLLLRYRIPAVAFVVAGLLDSREPLWWDEAAALAMQGGQTRTVTWADSAELVRRLKQVPDERRLEALEDLRQSAAGPSPNGRHVTRAELAELRAHGFTIANHSLTHACLPNCTTSKIAREIEQAHLALTDALGAPPTAFAYPNGDADGRCRQVLMRLGYRMAFLFDHRVTRYRDQDPLGLSRLRVSTRAEPARFDAILAGTHSMVHHARGRR